MGYYRPMGFSIEIPAHQVGGPENLWGTRGYGLSEVWDMRVSTVSTQCEPSPSHPPPLHTKSPWHFTSRWWARPLSQAQNQTQIDGVVNLGKDIRKAKGPLPLLRPPSLYAAPLLTQNTLALSSHPAVLSPRAGSGLQTMLYYVQKCRSLHLLDFLSMIRSLLDESPPCRSR